MRADLRFFRPQFYFPILRPLQDDQPVAGTSFSVDIEPCFYIPGILKGTDYVALYRSMRKWYLKQDREFRERAVIDAHFGYPEGAAAWQLAKEFGRPFFVTVRGSEVELLHHGGSRRRCILEALSRATGIIAVSDYLRDVLVKEGVDHSKIAVIRNGVDTELFMPRDAGALKTTLGIGANERIVISVGHLVERKRYDLVLTAMGPIMNQMDDVRLVIIGNEPDPKHSGELRELALRIIPKARISFLGPRPPEDVSRWLNVAELFIIASEREGCCNAVLEALAAGVPVICTPAGDNTFFVRNDEYGIVFPFGDLVALEKSIDRALKTSWDRAKIAASMQQHSWGAVAEKCIDFMHSRIPEA